MKHVRRLDKASSVLFFFSLICAKIRYIPFALLWPIFNSAALLFYLLGYSTWLIASLLRPQHARKKSSWYGFTEFKNQHKVAALLGIIATLLSIAAIACPVLLVPASWLFVIGNCFWCIAEYHKINNPPAYDKEYCPGKQKIYLRFALLMTLAGILGAIATTVSFCLPPLALAVIFATTIVAILLNFCALHEWIKCNTYHYGPDAYNHSYHLMSQHMPTLENDAEEDPEPATEMTPLDSSTEEDSTLTTDNESACQPRALTV